jgi:hypothetical protein
VICGDEKPIEVLPEGAICVAYKRNANLKELLVPSDPYKDRSRTSRPLGYFKCRVRRCDCCKNFLEEGTSFSSIATRRVFQIVKVLIFTTSHVVYLATSGQKYLILVKD